MKLSKESRYAIIALDVLAKKPPGTIQEVAQIAEEARLPAPFLAKIFGKLTRGGLLQSHRGRQRGYSLSRPPGAISLKDVLEAVDGPDLFKRCVFWSETCSDDAPCPLHDSWKEIRPLIAGTMEHTTLEDVMPE
jgi:Rrf2 family iron-sulfur cluster assembly transcriptional regulator